MTSLTENIAGRTRAAAAGGWVRAWLFMLSGLIFLMVVVGGATRLTDSGLSITEWQPIIGAVPPLSAADWQAAFQKYRQIPEYQRVNKGMSLAAFKRIYWWEWAHRFLGRFIGFAVALPFVFFWVTGRIERRLIPWIIGMLFLGGLQGLLGWYMVMSGLVERVDVSQYRLAAHLALAMVIFGYIFWLALETGGRSDRRGARTRDKGLVVSALGLVCLLFLQIILGAFVAGLDAGLSHNTWPLMDGGLAPDGLFAMTPWYANFFENAATVQFDHRLAAYLSLVWAAIHVAKTGTRRGEGAALVSAALLLVAIVVQAGLGIWTLLMQVPITLGLLHQGGAIIVFAVALYHLRLLIKTPEGVPKAAEAAAQ
jgi:cytochrome c oxidase assembly protein subunit 15